MEIKTEINDSGKGELERGCLISNHIKPGKGGGIPMAVSLARQPASELRLRSGLLLVSSPRGCPCPPPKTETLLWEGAPFLAARHSGPAHAPGEDVQPIFVMF